VFLQQAVFRLFAVERNLFASGEMNLLSHSAEQFKGRVSKRNILRRQSKKGFCVDFGNDVFQSVLIKQTSLCQLPKRTGTGR
jgi:hypothetical protein